jgi:tetratricopeptide (TPR) repeat protein
MPRPALAAVRHWRATFITMLVVMAVAGSAAAGWWYARESTPVRGPIVLISVEGLRPTRLPAYSSADAPAASSVTPSIDALAADAVLFERAYTHSPLTLPAHASLLAGQLPFEHGVRDEAGFALKNDARSMAELLQNRGFETGAAVSSFLLRPESGVAQGFSFFDAELPDQPPDALLPAVERDGAETSNAAARWVRSRRGRRFFLFVQVNERSAEPAVTQLVSELKELGLYDEATIVFTSDRGEGRAGASLDDTSLRVPLLVKQPESEGAGRRVAVPVQHIDILPTVLDLVRAPIPSDLRGRSLRGVLEGDAADVPDRPIYAESLAEHFRFGGAAKFAIATSDHRYVRGGREELIDLERGDVTTPSPAENLEVDRLRAELDQMLKGRPVEPPGEIASADEDQYAALGYLGTVPSVAAESLPIDPEEEARILETHREAAMLAGQKKYSAAIDHLRRIARAHSQMTVVRYQLGVLLARTGRLGEAEAAFRAAALVEPDNPYIPAALAGVLVRAGELDGARDRAALAAALAEHRDARARAVAYETAARVALAEDEWQQAAIYAEAAEREDPSVPLVPFVRGRMLHTEGRYEEALTEFERSAAAAAEVARPVRELHWYLGDTLARLDRHEDAEMQFREELRDFPRNIRAYVSLAMLYRAMKRQNGVEEVLDALIDAVPTPEGYDTAARLWTIAGERERAAALRADARSRFRGDPSLALFHNAR